VSDREGRETAPFDPVIWVFVAFRSVGILVNGILLLLFCFYALPAFLAGAGSEATGDLLLGALAPAGELGGVLVGFYLLLKRHPIVRRFWIGFHVLYCVVQLFALTVGDEFLGPAFFLITGLGWLAYWVVAETPKALPAQW
jgi:hypothetical protein